MSESVIQAAHPAGPPAGALAADEQWDLAYAQRDRLIRIAQRRSDNEHEAEDAVSEALVRAMTRSFDTEDHLSAWLTTVTVNLCTDAARDRGRWPRRAAYTARHLVPVPSPEQAAVDRDTARRLVRRLERLPSRQRQALLLRAAGFGVDEVAGELDVSYKTAESLLSRGRAALRLALLVALVFARNVIDAVRRSSVPVAATAAACVLGAVVVTAPWSGGHGPARVEPAPPAAGPVSHDVHRAHVRVRHIHRSAEPTHAAEQQRGASLREATSHRPASRVTRPVRVGHRDQVAVRGGGVTRSQPDETLVQSAVRCVREGLVVSTTALGCPED